MLYIVRVMSIGDMSILMSSPYWEEYIIDTKEELSDLAERLIRKGFSDGGKWIMPGAILWIKRKEK